jgi:hypothetical protein
MQRVYRQPQIAGDQASDATWAAPLAPARTPSKDLEPSTDPLCAAYPE